MDYFGINSSGDLPKIKEVFNEQTVQPTQIADSRQSTVEKMEDTDDEEPLAVTDEGELVISNDDRDSEEI